MRFLRPTLESGWRFLRKLALLVICGSAALVGAQGTPGPTEYQVKAAFIYNFAKFVRWPNEALPASNSPIVLGVLGDDAAGRDLDAVNGKVVGAHPIVVRRFRYLTEMTPCQILFILPSERLELPAIIQAVQSRSILTVCDGARDFARAGAVINLVKSSEAKIRFEINVDAAKRAALKIDSPLLNLAKIVRDPKTPP